MPDQQSPPPSPPGKPYGSPRDEHEEPDEETQKRAKRLVRVFALVLLITVVLALMAPPWPVPIVTAVVAVGSLVLGIVALVRVRSAKVRGATPAVVVGILVAAFMALTMSGQIVLWREYSAYSECMDSAITQQAQDGCLAELQNSLQERLDEMQQMVQTG